MDAVFNIAATVTVMVDGMVLAGGPPATIRADPAVQAAYLGEAA
jgi:branched-chain amino acid transport system ATP-binding protein